MINDLRFYVLERDKFTCQYCGSKAPDVALEIDHILPRAKGGGDNEENLTTACYKCNRGKRDIIIESVKARDIEKLKKNYKEKTSHVRIRSALLKRVKISAYGKGMTITNHVEEIVTKYLEAIN